MPDLGDQKRPSFFLCVFLIRKGDVLRREEFMNPLDQMRFAFRKGPVALSG